jgi:hypothetical protein
MDRRPDGNAQAAIGAASTSLAHAALRSAADAKELRAMARERAADNILERDWLGWKRS